jgi:hypothetical protein
MKKSIVLAIMLMAGLLMIPAMGEAQMMGGGMGGGMMGGWGSYGGGQYPPNGGGQYPPYGGGQYQGPGGGYGPGYGMGQGRGYGMGPGMMGPGYGNQYGPQYGPQYQERQKPLDKEEARREVENYLKSTGNPNLKLGKVTDEGSHFEANVVTKKNDSLVDKILVDKDTGWMRSGY